MDKEIEKALHANVDLPDEEYEKLTEQADQSTERHGVKGKAPVSEAKRHKRIQSNFYGTSVNIGMQILSALANVETLLKLIAQKLYSEEVNNGKRNDEQDKR